VFEEAMKRLGVVVSHGDNGTTLPYFVDYVKAMGISLSALAQNKGILSPVMVEGVLKRSIADHDYCEAAEIYKSFAASLAKLTTILVFGATFNGAKLLPTNGQLTPHWEDLRPLSAQASRHVEDSVNITRDYKHMLRRLYLDVNVYLQPSEMVACSDPPKFLRLGVGLCERGNSNWKNAGNLDAAECAKSCEQKLDCWLIAVKPGPKCMHFLDARSLADASSTYNQCTTSSLDESSFTTFRRQGPLDYKDLGVGVCKEFNEDPGHLKLFEFEEANTVGESRSVLDQCAARCSRDGSKCKSFSVWPDLRCRFYSQACTDVRSFGSDQIRTFAKIDQTDDDELLQGKYTIRQAKDSGNYLNMDRGFLKSHNNVHVWRTTNERSQWMLKLVESGAFILMNVQTKESIGVKAGSMDDGANVQAHACLRPETNTACHWRLTKVSHSSSTYLLQNVNSKRYLNVEGGSTRNWANVQQWNTQSSDSQWQLHKVSENAWEPHAQTAQWCRVAIPDGIYEYSYFGDGESPCKSLCCKRKLSCSLVPGGVAREWSSGCKCEKVMQEGNAEQETYLTGSGYYIQEKDPCPHGVEGKVRYFNIEDLVGQGCSCRLP